MADPHPQRRARRPYNGRARLRVDLELLPAPAGHGLETVAVRRNRGAVPVRGGALQQLRGAGGGEHPGSAARGGGLPVRPEEVHYGPLRRFRRRIAGNVSVPLPKRASAPERILVMRYLVSRLLLEKKMRTVREAIAPQLAELDLTPWRGARLGLGGMGASYNAILAPLGSYWTAGLMAAPWLGSDLRRPGAWRNIDAAIAVSQTGHSAEMVSCLEALPAGQPKLALTDDAASPVPTASDPTVSPHLLHDNPLQT